MNSFVETSIADKIATITFFHPAKNSFTSSQLQELKESIEKLNSNNNVTVIILQSEGNSVFCSGASFDELLAVASLEQGKYFFSGFANVINAMRKSNKIIIGRVQGKAVGGGVGLISACDYSVATQNASIKLSEIAIGIGPFVIEPVVSKKIGKNAMAQMTLEPTEWKSTTWALEKGLYDRIFDNETEMDSYLNQYAKQLANYNPEGLIEMKKVLWENTENWDELLVERAAISGKLVLSDFTVKALNTFKNK
nr:enoyl-CoA hydratase/isomerase family protein [uncultured Flavobacterium sp.]